MSAGMRCRTCRDSGVILHPALHRPVPVDCPDCPAPLVCPDCEGKCKVEREVNLPSTSLDPVERDVPMIVTCPTCDGAGVPSCDTCGDPATVELLPGQFFCATHTETIR